MSVEILDLTDIMTVLTASFLSFLLDNFLLRTCSFEKKNHGIIRYI
ncbi:hypothetical protein Aeqsu_2453 [Aequorivita sublithincola DSM 14238]|uniref:Uncharacterized protein n=1 Tax=Aequorivita sublithincola (strain DSM 14238 / LMG 21431 / ACAM 643 / 9-3) TaxID=746697 RepID=I3YY43_AEQSU|nr:hypothetical protein Aeqsu_2453 [Aequorivita sublithincola DSM 14238]